MMWATSALPQNGRLLVVGGGREAMANDAHGVDVRKNREAPVCQKKGEKRDVMWNIGESLPSDSPTQRTFYGNSYTAPTPSIHIIQQLGLTISKSYSTLLTNATRTFQRPPTAPQFDLYSFLAHSEDTYPVDT